MQEKLPALVANQPPIPRGLWDAIPQPLELRLWMLIYENMDEHGQFQVSQQALAKALRRDTGTVRAAIYSLRSQQHLWVEDHHATGTPYNLYMPLFNGWPLRELHDFQTRAGAGTIVTRTVGRDDQALSHGPEEPEVHTSAIGPRIPTQGLIMHVM